MMNDGCLVPSTRTLLLSVFLASVILLQAGPSYSKVAKQEALGKSDSVIAVWNKITFDEVRVLSRHGGQPIGDCARLNAEQSEVDCFSIQQNFWVSNSKGEMKFWAQDAVQLAELKPGVFFGTSVFIVWSSSDPFRPIFCDPSSLSDNYCRAPMYMDAVKLPQSFILYAGISNDGNNFTLHVANNFVSRSWEIPPSAGCPCFIETALNQPPAWGQFPFEFVVVGLDNSATAFFQEGTSGNIGPGYVQTVDHVWHEASLNTFLCRIGVDCPTPSATGENSLNLRWDNDTGRFYWSQGAYDRGVFISSISTDSLPEPPLPQLVRETYLYFRLGLRDLAYLTLVDGSGRLSGYNVSSGKIVVQIPHSFVTLSGEQGIMILNPNGRYYVVLTPTGSGPYHLLIIKTQNLDGNKTSRQSDGTIVAWEPKHFWVDSDPLALNQEENPSLVFTIGLGSLALVLASVLGFVIIRRRKRALMRNSGKIFDY
jgi:hypothetical protein